MIVVKVELIPWGIGEPRELGRMVIMNDGSLPGNGPLGNYEVRLGRKGTTDSRRIIERPVRRGQVKEHRRHAETVWSLVGKALRAVGY